VAAPSAPTAPRFSPVERPRAAIATDGTLAAIIESQRVVVLELPGGEPFAEVGVDPAALSNEVAWVGAPPRLLVISRYAEHTRVHLVDPHGPRALADLRIETPMRLAAVCGAHALVVSPQSAVIVTAADNLLVSVPYPARAVPAHAGVAGANFLVAHADSVEEWDPNARMPKRRLKLPRAATITALGGSDRVVWMTTQQEPSRLDVLALVDRGQPKAHDLPEPIAFAAGHPRSDLVACIGESGKVYVVDLDGRSKLKTLAVDGIDKVEAAGLVVGRIVGVLVAQTERPVVVHALEGPIAEPEPAAPIATTAGASTSNPAPAVPAKSTTSTSVVAPLPTADAPVERKKPPPPPPGRSGNTMPPPITAASPARSGNTVPPPVARSGNTVPPPIVATAHASVPSATGPVPSVATASKTGSNAALPASQPGSTSASKTGSNASQPGSTSASKTGSNAALPASESGASNAVAPTAAPGASSLARPATRAFARAPTPHPRAPSEGVDVDLEGAFDELSAEAHAYNERAPSPSSSEQFDSPLAFEARPVADHSAPTDGAKNPAKLTDPRPVPSAIDRMKADAKPIDGDAPKATATEKPAASSTAPASNTAPASSSTPASSTAPPASSTAPPASSTSTTTPGTPKPAPNETSTPSTASTGATGADDDSALDDDDDDDDDLAPPVIVRDMAPARDSGPMRRDEPVRRESQLSLRDAPLRKPVRREVTIRQGGTLPAPTPAWRDESVYWTYEVFDGVVQRGAPIASPLDDLAARFDVPDTILPSLVLLYGAHLAGERGVAPVHIARVLGSWDEALGRGLLASRGLATFVESRVRLAGPIQRFLDEVAVSTGALVGVPGDIALPGPHAVIAKAETPLKVVAVRWLAQVGGAILAAHDDADLAELFVEARARGAAPMFRIGADELLELGTDPAILVVTDEDVAESLGVPRLG
jgi:hypothetical protein